MNELASSAWLNRMTNFHHITPQNIEISPPTTGIKARAIYGPNLLKDHGIKLSVAISPATSLLEKRKTIENKSLSVRGLLDTGAFQTAIDESIADYLKLPAISSLQINTAAGPTESQGYSINLNFTRQNLQQKPNLNVNSVKLNFFNLKKTLAGDTNANIGVLIGRDVMSNWSITWHGPSSTVLISD